MAICNFEDCDRPTRCKGLCHGHYQQQYNGNPLTSLIRDSAKPECLFEGCDRVSIIKGLCLAHYEQQRKGKPLTPIGSTLIKYTDEDQCSRLNCTVKPLAKGLCSKHYYARKTKEGTNVMAMTSKYSTERFCKVCQETKDWKEMVIGMEPNINTCKDCYAKPKDEPKTPVSTEELLSRLGLS